MRKLLCMRPNESIKCGIADGAGGARSGGGREVPSWIRGRSLMPLFYSPVPRSACRIPHSMDPLAAALGVVLALPDGHEFLDAVDGVAARLERLGPVRAARRHRHAHLADAQPAQA